MGYMYVCIASPDVPAAVDNNLLFYIIGAIVAAVIIILLIVGIVLCVVICRKREQQFVYIMYYLHFQIDLRMTRMICGPILAAVMGN